MAKYNVKDFVSAYNQKEGTVKSWLHRGKLQKGADGLIDTDNAINKLLISEMQLKVNANLIGVVKENKSKSKNKESESNTQLEIPLNQSQKQYQVLDLRTRIANADKAESEAEFKRVQLEKMAGKLLPIELVERIFTINVQSIFKNFELENENLASLYVLDREKLSEVIGKQKSILYKAIEKAKEDARFEIENAINEYSETRSRGERK